MATKSEVEVEVKSAPEKFWEAIRDSTELFPKIFPEQYKTIELLEGDGKSVGSVRLVKYAEGTPVVTFAKEKVETVEVENKMVSYSVIDGEILNLYKNFKATLQVIPKPGAEGCLVKWTLEFDKASDEVPEPELIKEAAVKTFHGLDAYLQNN
ncbi:MLP-like protein 423 [Rhynchospora pubera]|uniref:MLP-like protein 423 n=1 Tax=Rhynchospora pubera TaxID=906938 RepID=A0AAV8FTT8_9POAL|nr:MLP-like protein 423 [Rhynchospora pubera]KAJ4818053.1 MLP-like protein 423 [Rhynchospora pubera]